jgi:hypothetical protein
MPHDMTLETVPAQYRCADERRDAIRDDTGTSTPQLPDNISFSNSDTQKLQINLYWPNLTNTNRT